MRIHLLFLALIISFVAQALGGLAVGTQSAFSKVAAIDSLRSAYCKDFSLAKQAFFFVKKTLGCSFMLTKSALLITYGFEKKLFLTDKRAFLIFHLLMIYPALRLHYNTKGYCNKLKKRMKKICGNIKNKLKDSASLALLGAAGAVACNALIC